MPSIVTAACIGCKSMDCISPCPVDAFHEGPEMLYINPETCIDCDACISECPVDAIYAEEDVPDSMHSFIKRNATMSEQYPVVAD